MLKTDSYQDIYLTNGIENELFLLVNNYLEKVKKEVFLEENLKQFVSDKILKNISIAKVNLDVKEFIQLNIKITSYDIYNSKIDTVYAHYFTLNYYKSFIPLSIPYKKEFKGINSKEIANQIYSDLEKEISDYVYTFVSEFINSIKQALNKVVTNLESISEYEDSISFKLVSADIYRNSSSKKENYSILYGLELIGKDSEGNELVKLYERMPMETVGTSVFKFYVDFINKHKTDYLSQKYQGFKISVNSQSQFTPTKIIKLDNIGYEIVLSAYTVSQKDLHDIENYLDKLYDLLIKYPIKNIGKHKDLFDYLISKDCTAYSIPAYSILNEKTDEVIDYKKEYDLLQEIQEDLNIVYSALEYNVVAFEKELDEFISKYKKGGLGYFYARKNKNGFYYPIDLVTEFSYLGNTYKYYFINDQYRNGKRKEKVFIKNDEKISKKEYKKSLIKFREHQNSID